MHLIMLYVLLVIFNILNANTGHLHAHKVKGRRDKKTMSGHVGIVNNYGRANVSLFSPETEAEFGG